MRAGKKGQWRNTYEERNEERVNERRCKERTF